MFAARQAISIWDEDAWGAISSRILELVRDAGVLALVPMAAAVRVA